MKPARSIPLLVSLTLALFLIGGGLAVEVGADENSYGQVVVFSEVLSLVLDNYVDPLEADRLLGSAYEGMLGSLDAHGAYLTPAELVEWKGYRPQHDLSDPGISVLKAGRSLQVVAVEEGSSAGEAGLKVGDQIRSVDGRTVRELSLEQAWRLIQGSSGSTVRLEVLQTSDGLKRKEIEVVRAPRRERPYELRVQRGFGVLHIADMRRLRADELAAELDDVNSRGVNRLVLDLRNLADTDPRSVAAAAGLFASGELLQLKDREGRLVESVGSPPGEAVWRGSIAVLVNGATAGSAEALALLVRSQRGGIVLGEPTYGLGSEAKLYELENGSGLLVSSALWQTTGGERWNGDGVEPDQVIRGKGGDFASRLADQFEQALDYLDQRPAGGAPPAA